MNNYEIAKDIINFARNCVRKLDRQQLLRLIEVIDREIEEKYKKP